MNDKKRHPDDRTPHDARPDDLSDADLDRMLIEATEQIQPPQLLVERIEARLAARSIKKRNRLRFVMSTGLAAAAMIGLAVVGRVLFPEKATIVPNGGPTPVIDPVRLTFAENFDAIAVHEQTNNPTVSIIWVYPVSSPAPLPEGEGAPGEIESDTDLNAEPGSGPEFDPERESESHINPSNDWSAT